MEKLLPRSRFAHFFAERHQVTDRAHIVSAAHSAKAANDYELDSGIFEPQEQSLIILRHRMGSPLEWQKLIHERAGAD